MHIRNVITVLIQIVFLLFIESTVIGQVEFENLSDLKDKDFVFKVLGHKEGPPEKIYYIEWVTFDNVLVGHNNYNFSGKNELKLFLNEEIMSIKYDDFEITPSSQANDGSTISWLKAKGEISESEIIEVALMKISGNDEIYLFLSNPAENYSKVYALSINY